MNQAPENLASVMRRIEKLLAIAQVDRANPEEASAAAGMAERIMRKYQLEHADVIMASLKAGNDMGEMDCIATAKTNGTKVLEVPLWASWLALQVARVNDCGAKIVRTANGEKAVRFYGFKSDAQVAGYTFNYLVATTNRLCKEFLKSEAYQTEGRRAVNSYRQGVSMGILSNLKKMVVEKLTEMKAATGGNQLMVLKESAIVEHYGQMKVSKVSRTSVNRDDSFSSGVRDGNSVDVNRRGVEGGDSSVKKLGR
jgi:hypothetical protein